MNYLRLIPLAVLAVVAIVIAFQVAPHVRRARQMRRLRESWQEGGYPRDVARRSV